MEKSGEVERSGRRGEESGKDEREVEKRYERLLTLNKVETRWKKVEEK